MFHTIVWTIITTWSLLWLFVRYAAQLGFIDRPNHRSVHQHPTPRGAGIVFGIVFFTTLLISQPHFFISHSALLSSIALVYFIGIYDDLRNTTPYLKFVFMGIAVLFAAYSNVLIDDVGTYIGYHVKLGWFALPFTLFAVIGFTNAFNFIDGLDGLAAIVGITILGFFAWLGYSYNDYYIRLVSLIFIVILSVFLLFNKPPAKVFMGDSGSLTIGFMIALLAVELLKYISGSTILFLTAVPLMDTFFVMFRRKRKGRSLFQADKCHLHHIAMAYFNKNIYKTLFLFWIVQLSFSLVGVLVIAKLDAAFGLVVFFAIWAVVYIYAEKMLRRLKMTCE